MSRPDRSARAPRLPPAIDRAEVAAVVARCLAEMPGERGAGVACDAGAVDGPRLATIDTIARLALITARRRQTLRLEHAGPELLDLLALCGLSLRVDEDDVGSG